MQLSTHTICLFFLLLFGGSLPAQSIYLSRFVPSNPSQRSDTHHRIEIYNQSTRTRVDVSGYVLVTRQYMVRLSGKIVIPPMKAIRLGRFKSTGRNYFSYEEMPDFTTRLPAGKDQGDFAILYDRNLKIVDAFYFSDQQEVSFLPAHEEFSTSRNKQYQINIPTETHSAWRFLQVLPDPAMAFVRINGAWAPNSRKTNLFPATQYQFPQTKYIEGIITLKWKTLFENDCYYHAIERSSNNRQFKEVSRKKGSPNSSRAIEYIFYDTEVENDKTYYYRIRNIDKFGHVTLSETVEVNTEENPGGFTFDIIPEPSDQGKYLNVRFSAKERQRVRIKLLDEELRQIAVLFYDTIESEKQNLIYYTEPLPFGIYHVLVETEQRRYRQLFRVE